jgi:hypothetical protein
MPLKVHEIIYHMLLRPVYDTKKYSIPEYVAPVIPPLIILLLV